jgi:hypothetical protein
LADFATFGFSSSSSSESGFYCFGAYLPFAFDFSSTSDSSLSSFFAYTNGFLPAGAALLSFLTFGVESLSSLSSYLTGFPAFYGYT